MGVSVATLKAPPITAISSASMRSKEWDDVLTAHSEDTVSRTWRVLEKRVGKHMLEVERGVVQVSIHFQRELKQSVCVSACGNFGLAGSSTGDIRMWNMQSGKERRTFSLTGPPPGDSKPKIIGASKPKAKKVNGVEAKSVQAITGLVTDALNTLVVASTLEGKLYVCPKGGGTDEVFRFPYHEIGG